MTRLAAVARLALPSTVALLLAAACGGQSFQRGDGNGDSGAGNGTGGSGSQAGSGTAGLPHGGSVGKGGGTGTSGSVGTGGYVGVGGTASTGGFGAVGGTNEACDAPPEPGSCEAAIESWYHEASTGLCRPFTYGGCDGNLNRYSTLEACQQACPDTGRDDYDSCKVPSDCVVVGSGCCGACDGPHLTTHDLVALNREHASALQCGIALELPNPPSAGVSAPIACEPCLALPSGQGTLAYFVPDCVRGQCLVQDLRTSPITACKVNADCRIRHGSNCCEGCGNSDLIAVRADGSLEKLVCGDGPVACPACFPQPTDAQPLCGLDHHCEVVIPL